MEAYADVVYRPTVRVQVRLSDGKITERKMWLPSDDDKPECEGVYRIEGENEFELNHEDFVEQIRQAELDVEDDADKVTLVVPE